MIHLTIHEDSSSIKYKSLVAFLHNEKIVFEQTPVLLQTDVSGSLPPAHAEMLVLAIDEFLPKEHPLRHHSSYRAIRKTLIDSGVISGNNR